MARKKSCTEKREQVMRGERALESDMCLNGGSTHTPDPVHQLDLFVQLHHEDDKEDYGEDHLADGDGGVTSV